MKKAAFSSNTLLLLVTLLFCNYASADESLCKDKSLKSDWKKIDFSKSTFVWIVTQNTSSRTEKNYFPSLTTKKAGDIVNLNKILAEGITVSPLQCTIDLFQELAQCASLVINTNNKFAIHTSEKITLKCKYDGYSFETRDVLCSQPVGITISWSDVADDTALVVEKDKASKFRYEISAFCRKKQD